MTLLLSRCESVVLHALGASALPPEISVLELVNRAGSWLCQQPWKWLQRQATVSTVAGTAYVVLPSDLRAVVSAQTRSFGMVPTSLDDIDARRAFSTAQNYPVIYALRDDLSAAGVFTKRLELFPTPSTVETIRVFYRAGWQTPLSGADSSRIAVPEDWEPLFIEALIAVAMGYQERDVAGVSVRLEALRASDMYQRLVRQDGMSQSNYGPMRGGGVEMQMGSTWQVEVPTSPAP